MLSNPTAGQRAQCWYANRAMPLHGRIGVIEIVGRGKPRNHGILIDGVVWVVPAGNLRKVEDGSK